MISIRIGEADFSVGEELARLEALGGGAVASFTGIVRGEGGLASLRLDHYPAMTQQQVARLVDRAMARWSLLGVSIIHRVGEMRPGDRIVFVGTASAHRQPALDACDFLIDWLKSAAPFWKKESFADGTAHWIEPREQDTASLERWKD